MGRNGSKELLFANFFVTKTVLHFTHFTAANFHESWTQNVSQYRHEFFQNRIAKYFQ